MPLRSQLTEKEAAEFSSDVEKVWTELRSASRHATWEHAKYLFATNAGAAAGIFSIVKDKPSVTLVFAFFVFCAGVWFIGRAQQIAVEMHINNTLSLASDFAAVRSGAMTTEAFWEASTKRGTDPRIRDKMFFAARASGWCIIIGAASAGFQILISTMCAE